MAMPPPPPPLPPTSPSRAEEGFQPPGPNTQASGLVVCLNVLNTITHLLLGAVTFSALIYTNALPFPTNFTVHVHMCVTGYVILMSQAILSFSPYTGWANNLKYPQKRMAHWLLQVSGSILALIGGFIMMANLESNLQSAHGIAGFTAMILTAVSLVGGIVHLVVPEKVNTVTLKIFHAFVGSLTLSVAFIALCLGFDLTRDFLGDANAILCIVFTVVALLGTLVMAFINILRRGFNCYSFNSGE